MAVRKEYEAVPEEQFIAGRCRWAHAGLGVAGTHAVAVRSVVPAGHCHDAQGCLQSMLMMQEPACHVCC